MSFEGNNIYTFPKTGAFAEKRPSILDDENQLLELLLQDPLSVFAKVYEEMKLEHSNDIKAVVEFIAQIAILLKTIKAESVITTSDKWPAYLIEFVENIGLPNEKDIREVTYKICRDFGVPLTIMRKVVLDCWDGVREVKPGIDAIDRDGLPITQGYGLLDALRNLNVDSLKPSEQLEISGEQKHDLDMLHSIYKPNEKDI